MSFSTRKACPPAAVVAAANIARVHVCWTGRKIMLCIVLDVLGFKRKLLGVVCGGYSSRRDGGRESGA